MGYDRFSDHRHGSRQFAMRSSPTAHGSSRVHYAWVIALVTFVVMLITAGVRATPALFMVPLETEFGWSRTLISASIAVNIALFGLIGPFAASVMDRWGLRRVVLGALALVSGAVAMSTQMSAEWQFFLLWGVAVGAGTGVTAMVLAAVVATRWFDTRRGLVMGMLSAANATGQLIFLTLLAAVVEASNWRSAALIVAAAAAGVIVLVWLVMRDRPADLGLRPYGQAPDVPLAAPQRRCRHYGRCGWPRAPRRSGFSPAPSSSAARARMVSSARI